MRWRSVYRDEAPFISFVLHLIYNQPVVQARRRMTTEKRRVRCLGHFDGDPLEKAAGLGQPSVPIYSETTLARKLV